MTKYDQMQRFAKRDEKKNNNNIAFRMMEPKLGEHERVFTSVLAEGMLACRVQSMRKRS